MILDDGGDATMLVMLGAKAEKDPSVLANPKNEEEKFLVATIKRRLEKDPTFYSRCRDAIRGVSEETTTGVMRLYQMESPSRSSTINTAAVNRWSTRSAAAPT